MRALIFLLSYIVSLTPIRLAGVCIELSCLVSIITTCHCVGKWGIHSLPVSPLLSGLWPLPLSVGVFLLLFVGITDHWKRPYHGWMYLHNSIFPSPSLHPLWISWLTYICICVFPPLSVITWCMSCEAFAPFIKGMAKDEWFVFSHTWWASRWPSPGLIHLAVLKVSISPFPVISYDSCCCWSCSMTLWWAGCQSPTYSCYSPQKCWDQASFRLQGQTISLAFHQGQRNSHRDTLM